MESASELTNQPTAVLLTARGLARQILEEAFRGDKLVPARVNGDSPLRQTTEIQNPREGES